MILLSHERQRFSHTNKRSARRRPPASAIRRGTELRRIEILHVLLEHFYDSQCNEKAAQLADFIGGS